MKGKAIVLTWAEVIRVLVLALAQCAIAGAMQLLQMLAKYLFE